ncbi:PDZ domain-containing protein [Corticibacter populi]|uniref:PDZ domain-containing protein n=1 Tax=Corticibacter populi TaxID=1550736 RepID=A0A3M6QZ46_9BURK|nr:trypsin-like peptidase domain-containing protein [Corticibacter populi]RMX07802.1 PDZ domain-containing protein [Corticibacter populi]RZS35028.1 serine peptidase DegS [Corticibacter populi]
MRRCWLLFSQWVTVALAVFFVLSTLRPGWLAALGPASDAPAEPDAIQWDRSPAPARPDPVAGSFRAAAEQAAPSVVSINTTKTIRHPYANDPLFQYFFGDATNQSQSGLGSGVIVSAHGYLLTNNHVIESADEITVTLHDGRELPAQVVGTDPDSDLAVLKIGAEGLPAIRIGNSDQLAIGDPVLAIGNPFGVGQTVTSGIISALGRNHLGLNLFENFIQTDAAINPGNSGGALVDTQGDLLGINTAIFSQSGGSMGIGFAIPASTAEFVLESLQRDGRVIRGWVGLVSNDLTPELAQAAGVDARTGVIVTGVLQEGPAARAGIRPGDVITQVGEKAIRNVPELLGSVAALRPGAPTQITVHRHEQAMQVTITPDERPPTVRTGAAGRR